MKKTPIAIVLMLLVTVFSNGLTISNAKLELTIHEENGRFTLLALSGDGSKKSLLVKEDPRTTILTVLSGTKIYRMGDSFEFRQAVLGVGDSASITWSSSSLTVIERFSLNGPILTVTVSIENISEQEKKIGMRYLLDTYLGEKGEHFTADGLSVKTETDYVWATPYEVISSDGEKTQLVISLTNSGITEPDRIVAANWKRLNDASWNFEANQSRDFSLLPYSINDSALALYYEPVVVSSKAMRSVSLELKWSDPSTAAASSGTAASTGEPTAESSKLTEEIRSEIIKIDSLIIRIDSLLTSGATPSEADVSEAVSSLDDLEARKKEINEQQ
jgi:hypothetical protein